MCLSEVYDLLHTLSLFPLKTSSEAAMRDDKRICIRSHHKFPMYASDIGHVICRILGESIFTIIALSFPKEFFLTIIRGTSE